MGFQFKPTKKFTGERTGLVVMGLDYAGLFIENTKTGIILSQPECNKADRGESEKTKASVSLDKATIYLRSKFSTLNEKIATSDGGHDLVVQCNFSYSTDGVTYQPCGWVDIDWFKVEK